MAGLTEMKPYTRKGEELIAGIMNGPFNMTASEYHSVRDGLMKMRSADPAMGGLYDKYLTDVVKNGKSLPTEQMQKLQEGLKKQGLGLSTLVNDVGMDLKAHNYSSSYRPPVMVSVNGRPMHPEVIANELKSIGVNIEGDIPRSTAPGKVSNTGLVVKQSALAEGLEKAAEGLRRGEDIQSKFGGKGISVIGQVAEHSGGLMKLTKMLPFVGKLASAFGLVAGATGAMAAPTPEARNDALIKEGINFIDPTGGIITEGVPLAIKDIRENGARRSAESRVNPHNLAITRKQEFLFDPEHPGQLASLRISDSGGKPLLPMQLLKEPSGQKIVLDEIDKRMASAVKTEMRELFAEMKIAAREFIDLEDRRKPVQEVRAQVSPVVQATPTIAAKI